MMGPNKKSNRQPAALPSRRSMIISGLGIILLSLVGLGLLEIFGGLDRLVQIVEDSGPWAPVMFVSLKTLTYVIAPLSGAPLKITAGALFGFGPGVFYSLLGDALGSSLNYWIARGLGRPAIARLTGSRDLAKIDILRDRVGSLRALIFSRIVLSAVYDFISYAAGLTRIPFGMFIAVTVLGGIVPVALTVGLGALYTKNPLLLIATYAGLAALVWLGFIGWRKWQRAHPLNSRR